MQISVYLHGQFNGSLRVAIEENGTIAARVVWERNGQWTDDWEQVALELTSLHHGYIAGMKVDSPVSHIKLHYISFSFVFHRSDGALG